MADWLRQPWPWYVAGPLIGIMVPLLLIIGNKSFGVSSSLRHICAACFPGKVSYFNYNWRNELWNLLFVAGILAGAWLTVQYLGNPEPVKLNPKLVGDLEKHGIHDFHALVPGELFNWGNLLTAKGLLVTVAGGFLVGFGTRYAGGCTSGHAIMGMSTLQFPSLVTTVSFMAGGFLVANTLVPYLLNW